MVRAWRLRPGKDFESFIFLATGSKYRPVLFPASRGYVTEGKGGKERLRAKGEKKRMHCNVS